MDGIGPVVGEGGSRFAPGSTLGVGSCYGAGYRIALVGPRQSCLRRVPGARSGGSREAGALRTQGRTLRQRAVAAQLRRHGGCGRVPPVSRVVVRATVVWIVAGRRGSGRFMGAARRQRQGMPTCTAPGVVPSVARRRARERRQPLVDADAPLAFPQLRKDALASLDQRDRARRLDLFADEQMQSHRRAYHPCVST